VSLVTIESFQEKRSEHRREVVRKCIEGRAERTVVDRPRGIIASAANS
jgi:hypothetical protein